MIGEKELDRLRDAFEPLPDGVVEEPKAETPKDDENYIFVCVGPNVWGKGFSKESAIREAEREAGKRLRKTERVLYTCTDAWAYVDPMGFICYANGATLRKHEEKKR